MKRRLALTIGVACLVAASCGGASARVEAKDDPGVVPADNDSTSSSWLDVGNQITAGRANRPVAPGVDPANAQDSGFGPYLTEPLTIDGNGSFDLIAGPLSETDLANTHFAGVSFPPDIEGAFDEQALLQNASVVQRGTDSFLDIPITVTNFQHGYEDLRAWVQ